jgi:hypothetical protein
MSWKDDNPVNKTSYNQGDRISTKEDPVWKMDYLNTPVDSTPVTPTHTPCGYWWKDKEAGTADDYPDPTNCVYYHDIGIPAIVEFKDGIQSRILNLETGDTVAGNSAAIDTLRGKGYWKVQATTIIEVDLTSMKILQRYDQPSYYNIRALAFDLESEILFCVNMTEAGPYELWHLKPAEGWKYIYHLQLDSGWGWGDYSPMLYDSIYKNLYTFEYDYDVGVNGYIAQRKAFAFGCKNVWSMTAESLVNASQDGMFYIGCSAKRVKRFSIPLPDSSTCTNIDESVTIELGAEISIKAGDYDYETGAAYFATGHVYLEPSHPCYVHKWPKASATVENLEIANDGSYSGLAAVVMNKYEKKLYVGLDCPAIGNTRLVVVDPANLSILSTIDRTSAGDSGLHCGLYYGL